MGLAPDLRGDVVRLLTTPRRGAGFRRLYGASPQHLLLGLCFLALTVYAGLRLLSGDALGVAVWFVGAALVHDLVFLPLYTLAERALRAVPRAARGGRGRTGGRVLINYVRVPAFLSLLLLLVWYPLILDRVGARYAGDTGLDSGVFLGRWLLITAVLFALSALCLSAAVWRARAPRPRRGPRARREDG
jgi:hypothetical protein